MRQFISCPAQGRGLKREIGGNVRATLNADLQSTVIHSDQNLEFANEKHPATTTDARRSSLVGRGEHCLETDGDTTCYTPVADHTSGSSDQPGLAGTGWDPLDETDVPFSVAADLQIRADAHDL